MSAKRHVSLLVPYRVLAGEPWFFLQVRDAGAPHYPNRIGLFGGHVEPGETAMEAMLRESAEELSVGPERPFRPARPLHVMHQEDEEAIRDVFATHVGVAFAREVRVHEGERGVWLAASAIDAEPLVVDACRPALRALRERLARNRPGPGRRSPRSRRRW